MTKKIRSAALLAVLQMCAALAYTPAAAAPLGVNLVANADFESVDLAAIGEENGPRILGWTGRNAYAYSHDGSSSNAGPVPDYAQGPNPPNAGHWYFTPTNTGGTDITAPNEFYQDIDVSTGPSGAAIAKGSAYYHLSAYLSSKANDDGYPHVDLQFFSANGVRVDVDGIAITGVDGPDDIWKLTTLSQLIQTNVTRIRVSLFGERRTGGYNGYVDNLVITIDAPEPATVCLAMLPALAALGVARPGGRNKA